MVIPTEACLEALHRLTLATVTLEQLGVRVATSFTTLPSARADGSAPSWLPSTGRVG